MGFKKEFVHLHTHSDFSLQDGAIQTDHLADYCTEVGFPAVAITDHGNLHGVVSFAQNFSKTGVKPIIGMEAYIARGSRKTKNHRLEGHNEGKHTNHLILLAQNEEGYRNLMRLSSLAYTEGFYYKPRIDKEALSEHSTGLIALSGCLSGGPAAFIAQNRVLDAQEEISWYREVFGPDRYYLELQSHQGFESIQQKVNSELLNLSKKMNVKVVATNDAHFLRASDFQAHKCLICSSTGKSLTDTDGLFYSNDHYVKTPDEMWALFGGICPEALVNTVKIAEMCDFVWKPTTPVPPKFPIPEGLTANDYLRQVATMGLNERLDKRPIFGHSDQYWDRFEYEFEVIQKMGFSDYFLIVWDLIRYAKDTCIPVGPGRGSSAGSLIAYALGITDVDPIRFGLLFERFLNPERVSLPDIDIDLCSRGRDQVFDHLVNRYGHDKVAKIITFQTLAGRNAIKDVARAMSIPYPEADALAKSVPEPVRGRNVSLKEAVASVPMLQSKNLTPVKQNVLDAAQRLEGCSRNASIHAAGVVIAPGPLPDYVPVCLLKDKHKEGYLTVTQYDMDGTEKSGLIKMDLLGLSALTIIEETLGLIQKAMGFRPDLTQLELDDPKVYELFLTAQTDGIFQFESDGIKNLAQQMKVGCFEDIVALNALYRPGPLDSGLVDRYVERKNGRESVVFEIPALKFVLESTYGILVYQEQVLKVFQIIAGYSAAEADLVRRAMGKKKRSELDAHKEVFYQKGIENKYQKQKLEKLWQEMEGFADYAFNRSHAVCYALVAYHMAWLKTYYPAFFWAAILSNEQKLEKLGKYCEKIRQSGIKILPPDINKSEGRFTAGSDGKTLRFGLLAIKGLGETTVNSILQIRQAGVFTSIEDFILRVGKTANRKTLEVLIQSGASDCLPGSRQFKKDSLEELLKTSSKLKSKFNPKQQSLFDWNSLDDQLLPDHQNSLDSQTGSSVESWRERMWNEYQLLGGFFTADPLQPYYRLMKISVPSIRRSLNFTEENQNQILQIAGVLTTTEIRVSKKNTGSEYARIVIENPTGSLECLIWSKILPDVRKYLKEGSLLVVRGRLKCDTKQVLQVEAVQDLDEMENKRLKSFQFILPLDVKEEIVPALKQLVIQHNGPSLFPKKPLYILKKIEDGSVATILVDKDYYLRTDSGVIVDIQQNFPQIQIIY